MSFWVSSSCCVATGRRLNTHPGRAGGLGGCCVIGRPRPLTSGRFASLLAEALNLWRYARPKGLTSAKPFRQAISVPLRARNATLGRRDAYVSSRTSGRQRLTRACARRAGCGRRRQRFNATVNITPSTDAATAVPVHNRESSGKARSLVGPSKCCRNPLDTAPGFYSSPMWTGLARS